MFLRYHEQYEPYEPGAASTILRDCQKIKSIQKALEQRNEETEP